MGCMLVLFTNVLHMQHCTAISGTAEPLSFSKSARHNVEEF